MPTKRCLGYFLFCLDLELLMKIVSVIVQKPGYFEFAINSRSKPNKKNPEHPFVDNGKKKTCAKF